MKKLIVLISVDIINAFDIANDIMGQDFKSIPSVKKFVIRSSEYVDDEWDKSELVQVMSLDDFISGCNDETINMSNYFISCVDIID